MALIDLAMVGTLGNNTIAAVGLSVFSNTLVLAFMVGIAPAVQGIVARRRGQGSTEPISLPLNGGLLIALLMGIPLTLICYSFSPFFFSLISSDPEVTKIGVPFLQTLYLAIVAVGMNCAFRGYWAGMEKPKVYTLIALFMNCLNIFLNYIFIFGNFGAPALGATGAAIGTVLSLYTGVAINFAIIYYRFRKDGFLNAKPERSLLARIFQMAMPASMQEFFMSAGYIAFFWMIGQIGTDELAAANVVVRITMLLLLLSMSLGNASATLVSKTLGAGDHEGAAQWGWDAGKLGIIVITLLGLPLFLFPKLFLSIFLSDPHAISLATTPLRIVGVTAGIASLVNILAYTLYSVGDGNRVTMVAFSTTWLFFLPAVWIVGPYLQYGLLQIFLVQLAYSLIANVLLTSIWVGGRWKKIKI
jgi:putative MATE family efflux protein